MKETPLLFTTESVRAILDGRKTQTRRVIVPQPDNTWHIREQVTTLGNRCDTLANGYSGDAKVRECPYGQVGDRLWLTQGASSSKSIPFEERFWGRIIKFDSHWEWMRHTNRKRYGMIRRGGKEWSVHRLMWELEVGTIPAGIHVLHKCDMPWCVNPNHLYLGTNDDNIADKIARNRLPKSRGIDNSQSRLTNAQVDEIRSLYWEQWLYQREIAERFNISQSEVSRIVHAKRWLGDSEYPEKALGHRTLGITEVKAEKLQKITSGDCLAEGIEPAHNTFGRLGWKRPISGLFTATPYSAFQELWDSLNVKPKPRLIKGKIAFYESYPWEDIQETRTFRGLPWYVHGNPFVFPISFRRCNDKT